NAEGEIPQPAIERLKGIGQWMKVNSESIYETTASPFYKLPWGRCTKKTFINGATLYLHVFDWPKDGKLVLPGLKNKVQQAYLLGDLRKLKTTSGENSVTVELPAKPLDVIDTVVALKVEGKLDVKLVVPGQNNEGVVELTAKMADIHNVFGSHAKLEGEKGNENVGSWIKDGAWVEWMFEVKSKGVFEIVADVAVKSPETKCTVTVGAATLQAEVPSTGGENQYKQVSLGQVKISKAGVHKLRIKPVKKKWNPMNLRSVLLRPAN
ncbi:unnamed protein product, partial [marine sediment metagenome]